MTIYVDQIRHYPLSRWSRKHWCHMVTDGRLNELHAMAEALGLPRARLHHHRTLPHYDLTPEARGEAIRLGARPVGRREIADLLRRVRRDGLSD